MKQNIQILLALITILLILPQLSCQREDALSDSIEHLYDNCNQPDTPGGFAVAVIKEGKVVFKKAYGYANYEHQIPFTPHTVSDYASVAKQFTGFAVATLVNEKKLGLNDGIHQYLPELPDFGEKITVRHLLNHTSGIRDWVGLVKLSGRYKGDVITDDFLMKLARNQKDLNFKPGEKFQYSNLGYFLLAEIIARVTDQPFSQWTRENIFQPLHMNDTSFCDDYREIIFDRADSYKHNQAGEYVNSSNHLEAYGSSSLFSTLDDMIKWMKNYETRQLGGPEVWDMMYQKGKLNNQEETDYGFGISFNDNQGLISIGHGGSWAGYLCQLSYFPEHRISTILATNRDPSGVYVDQELQGILMDRKKKPGDAVKQENPNRTEVEIDPSILSDYTGTYLFFDNLMKVDNREEQLEINFPWGQTVPIFPETKNKFFRKDFDAQFVFLRGDDGTVDRCVYYFKGHENNPFRKLKEQASEFADLEAVCGDYKSPELLTTYGIIVKDDHLILEHLHNEDVTLFQLDQDHYRGNQWWFSEIELMRDDRNQVTGFKLNADSNNIQNLVFLKDKSI